MFLKINFLKNYSNSAEKHFCWRLFETKIGNNKDDSNITRPILIDSNPDEHNVGLNYYTFMVHLDRYNGSCNSFNDCSDKICVPNQTGDANLHFWTHLQE